MNPATYTRTAIVLHWLIAALVFGMLALGVYMSDLSFSPQKLRLYNYHKWIGVSLFVLMGLRLVWRLTHTPPPLPAQMPRWQQVAAHGLHASLYLILLLIPISGWLMSSAKGVSTVWFGLLPLPDVVAKDRALGETLAQVHQALNIVLVAMIAAHILAALKHQLIDRDGLLARMSWPRRP